MIKLLKITLIILTVILTGCASTVTTSGKGSGFSASTLNSQKIIMTVSGADDVTGNKDWEQMRQEWNIQMQEVSRNAGLHVEFSPKEVEPGKDAGTLIAIKVNDYRYVSLGARIAVGVMTGNAWLDVDVEYRDLGTGNLVSTSNYQTKSTAWQGAFSAMTEKQVESVCTVMVHEIITRSAVANSTPVASSEIQPASAAAH